MANSSSLEINLDMDTSHVEGQLRSHFRSQTRFTFEGVVGRGAYGVTCKVIESLPGGRTRRLALKRASDDRAKKDLRNEIRFLKWLRGAEHIVRMIADRDEGRAYVGTRHIRRALNSGTQATVSSSLIGLTGPVIVLEYMDNGDTLRLHYRLMKHKVMLPNRVIWSFFLCVIRACIGLTYPINGGPEQPTTLETIPTDGREPSRIIHGDMHMGNIMVGQQGGAFPEHASVPALKLIDFGMARQLGVFHNSNLYRASMVIFVLMTGRQPVGPAERSTYKGIVTEATEILPHGNGDNYPTLDPDLRDLMALCLAMNESDRPSLAVALQAAEAGVAKTADSYAPYVRRETDEHIRMVLKYLIYDADSNEPSADLYTILAADQSREG